MFKRLMSKKLMAHAASATHDEDNEPHVTPLPVYFAVFGALIVLTVVTVGMSLLGLPPVESLIVAMLVATVKALIVALWFMHLISEERFYGFILVSTVFFMGLFFVLTLVDLSGGDASNIEESHSYWIEWIEQAVKDTAPQGDANVTSESMYAQSARLRRTPWLDALVNRYFFEKIIKMNRPPGCDFYLEKQIFNEVTLLVYQFRVRGSGQKRDEAAPRAPVFREFAADEASFFAEQAVRFLESRIFENISISELTSHLKTSESALRRHFQASFGMTIGGYIKARRQDEAALLLKRGDMGVEDVCLFVGYADVSSFSKFFKAKFGVSPKKVGGNQ